MNGELYTLAPSRIASKAKDLASHGLFAQALELLERNKVEFEVTATSVEVRLPRVQREYKFKRGNKYGQRQVTSNAS